MLVYVNRLSDLLFVLARYACHATNAHELAYMKSTDGTMKATWRRIKHDDTT